MLFSGIVKVWDVRVGKVLQEFNEHTSSVTCIKFHPHEFLLASCGADKTVNFWDMEKFQLVSKFEKEQTSIRYCIIVLCLFTNVYLYRVYIPKLLSYQDLCEKYYFANFYIFCFEMFHLQCICMIYLLLYLTSQHNM